MLLRVDFALLGLGNREHLPAVGPPPAIPGVPGGVVVGVGLGIQEHQAFAGVPGLGLEMPVVPAAPALPAVQGGAIAPQQEAPIIQGVLSPVAVQGIGRGGGGFAAVQAHLNANPHYRGLNLLRVNQNEEFQRQTNERIAASSAAMAATLQQHRVALFQQLHNHPPPGVILSPEHIDREEIWDILIQRGVNIVPGHEISLVDVLHHLGFAQNEIVDLLPIFARSFLTARLLTQ
jgi:hypothetical protein